MSAASKPFLPTSDTRVAEFNAGVEVFKVTVTEQTEAVREAVRSAEDKPKLDPVAIEPEITAEPIETPLLTTADPYVVATLKLRASKQNFTDNSEDDAFGEGAP